MPYAMELVSSGRIRNLVLIKGDIYVANHQDVFRTPKGQTNRVLVKKIFIDNIEVYLLLCPVVDSSFLDELHNKGDKNDIA